MRLIFFGVADFAIPALKAAAKQAQVIAAVTAPAARGARGMKAIEPPLKAAANELQIPVSQPQNPAAAIALVKEKRPDALVVAAYGRILPRMLLRLPKRGTLNIHPSLLPRWRGAAPIERAILAGDTQTGATIMQMDCGLDSGAILLQEKIPLLGDAGEMRSKLADLGAALLSRALRELPDLSPRPQNDADATYAAKIDKSDTAIRWDDSAAQIARQVRAFSPTPGAHTVFSFNNNDDKSGERIKIFAAHPAPSNSDNKNREPGEIIGVGKDGVVIACGENDALVATKLQRAGGRILNAAEFCRGYKQIAIGHKFAKPPREEASSPPLPNAAAGMPSDSPSCAAPKFRIRGRT